MKRKFESSTWMHLMDEEELKVLKRLMIEKSYNGKILEVNRLEDKNRLLVWIRMPGYSLDHPIKALYGEDYRKWESIKAKIYSLRRKT